MSCLKILLVNNIIIYFRPTIKKVNKVPNTQENMGQFVRNDYDYWKFCMQVSQKEINVCKKKKVIQKKPLKNLMYVQINYSSMCWRFTIGIYQR